MQLSLSLVIVVVVFWSRGQASEDTSGNYTECKDGNAKGSNSFFCPEGGPATQFPPDCSSEEGNALVIEGMDLAFTGTCRDNDKNTLHSVSCLAELERSAALRSLERAVLEGCSGRPNCSVAQVPPLQLPGLASAVGYLKVTSSCVRASPANTLEFCTDSSLRGDKVFLHYSAEAAGQALDSWECRCQAKGDGNLSVQALAVWQREAGSSVTFLSGTGPSQQKRVWPPSRTLHGEKRQVFPGPDLSVTVGPLHRSRPGVVWLQLSGASGEVEVTCNAPEAAGKESQQGKHEPLVPAFVWVILGVCCGIVCGCLCFRRRWWCSKIYHRQHGDETVAVHVARRDEKGTAPAQEAQPPPTLYDVARPLFPEPDPPSSDLTRDAPSLYQVSSLYSHVVCVDPVAPRSEVTAYSVPRK